MNLVKIQSATENDFIRQLAKDNNGHWPWIGLSKRSNGEWMWQDGGALNYKNWASGEPIADYKECCMYGKTGQWWNCGTGRYFLCKK